MTAINAVNLISKMLYLAVVIAIMPGTSIATKHILFAGNPGSGKSTLLNCLMQSSANKVLTKQDKFQSGVAIGSGMTYQLDTKTLDGVFYMDTPGLSDTKKRKQAAEAITEALKKDGAYQIVFVVTLESGRVRPDDVTTMTLILESAKEITHYGVIFNKLGKRVVRMLNNETKMELLSQVSLGRSANKPIPVPLFLRNYAELEDEDDVLIDIPKLEDFMKTLLPIRIHKDDVSNIPIDTYGAMKEKAEEELAILRENNELLQQKMKEDQELFKKRIDEILQQEKERFDQQKKEITENHEKVMTEMQRQLDESRENARLMAEKDERAHELQLQQMKTQQENFKEMMAQQEKAHQQALQAMKDSQGGGGGILGELFGPILSLFDFLL